MCENNEDSFRHYFWFQMGTAYRKEVADVSCLEIHVQSEDLICIEYCKFCPTPIVMLFLIEHQSMICDYLVTIIPLQVSKLQDMLLSLSL